MDHWFSTWVAGLLLFVLTAGSAAAQDERPLHVVATTAMIGDVVRNVGGDAVTVEWIMGEGVDPHLYRATRADMALLLRADIVFYNGLLLEGKMVDALVRLARRKPVVAVTGDLSETDLLAPEGSQGHHDPHVWMDPLLWVNATHTIGHQLSELRPEQADLFVASAKDYEAQLRALHDYASASLQSIPESSRILVTAHDAFEYFSRRYDLDVLGIQGISTDSEAGIADIQRIVGVIVDRRVAAVFTETTVSERNINALIAGAAAQGHTVVIGGSLFSDAMGPPGTYEGTYIGMIDHNVTLITRALGGSAPQKGLNGRLSAESSE